MQLKTCFLCFLLNVDTYSKFSMQKLVLEMPFYQDVTLDRFGRNQRSLFGEEKRSKL